MSLRRNLQSAANFAARLAAATRLLGVVFALCLSVSTVANSQSVFDDVFSRKNADKVELTIRLKCAARYVAHSPTRQTNVLTIKVEPFSICTNYDSTLMSSLESHEPRSAPELRDIEYDGARGIDAFLRIRTKRVYATHVEQELDLKQIRVVLTPVETAGNQPAQRISRRVNRTVSIANIYSVNLDSSTSRHDAAVIESVPVTDDQFVYESEIDLDGVTWYRLRLGFFSDEAQAHAKLEALASSFPRAWVAAVTPDEKGDALPVSSVASRAVALPASEPARSEPNEATASNEKLQALLAEGKAALAAKDHARAVGIYTKILQYTNHQHRETAQEYLGIARERAGQIAHAKAEFQRFLNDYPESDAYGRVEQRLAAIIARGRGPRVSASRTGDGVTTAPTWTFNRYLSQYYRRDSNQFNEQEELVSQSSLFSDADISARRRGQRFDVSMRVSAGYSHDFLPEEEGPGNLTRVSFAYADIADQQWKLRARVGRQSRNTGGILGRFDGLHVARELSETTRLNFVAGFPVDSSKDGFETQRQFQGVSFDLGTLAKYWNFNFFYNRQTIDGVEDRSAIGSELRYADTRRSVVGVVDYDTSYSSVNSVFVQGNWRIGKTFAVHGGFNRRNSPYLTTRNAIVGQLVADFDDLLLLFTEDEIRQLAVDRTASSNNVNLGLSASLTPTVQWSVDYNRTEIDATVESGGVQATPAFANEFLGTSLVVSSVFREGDVFVATVRRAESNTAETMSVSLDVRYPLSGGLKLSPRLRIDQRTFFADNSEQLIFSPTLRMQYRWRRKYQFEFEAGGQFSDREMELFTDERESYFVSLGYRYFF